MVFDKDIVDKMSIPELEETLALLKTEDKYPHLAALIAYILTYHYYYKEENDRRAKEFYQDTLALLETPSGYGWCITAPHVLAGITCPHFLHKEVVKRNFSRLSSCNVQ